MAAESRASVLAEDRQIGGAGPGRWFSRRLLSALLARFKVGRLTVVTPDGERISSVEVHPGPEAVAIVHRWRTLRRLILGGDVAFAEAYIDGDWSSPDMAALVELAACNDQDLRKSVSGYVPARLANRLRHLMRANSRRGSSRNIMAHYDLGNSFYRRWLDAGMSYSSGLYRSGAETLEEAQTAKQDRIIDALGIRGGERVLEIGCGWGGLAERLGERGCRVTGITLSPAQLEYGQRRIGEAGLADRVQLIRQDYRDVEGQFDRIVSVEMIEAVGQAYWPSYFGVLRNRLAAGGRVVLQAITITDDRFPFYVSSPDFIQRYVFPGGMLLSPSILRDQSEAAGFEIGLEERLGPSYALTLREWRRRFLATWQDAGRDGFDEPFRRLWDYYLAYCEGGFAGAATDVGIYRLTPRG